MKKLLQFVGIVLAVLIPAGLMTYKIVSSEGLDCEVCIEFRGRMQCRTARGLTQSECHQTAASNTCAFLASGVTDSLACERSEKQTFRLVKGN